MVRSAGTGAGQLIIGTGGAHPIAAAFPPIDMLAGFAGSIPADYIPDVDFSASVTAETVTATGVIVQIEVEEIGGELPGYHDRGYADTGDNALGLPWWVFVLLGLGGGYLVAKEQDKSGKQYGRTYK